MQAETEQYYRREHSKSAGSTYIAQLLTPLEVPEGAEVLDVGCGTGYINAYLAGRGRLRRNLGFDLDPDALRLARELNPAALHVGWFCASAEAIPLPDASLDRVICRGAVPLCDVTRVLDEIGRVLRPGGRAMLLLHPWHYYLHWLSVRPSLWKRTAQGLASTALSAWFNATGHQIRLRYHGQPVGQTFQTVGRAKAILRRRGMEIYHVVRAPEFIVYARHDQARAAATSR